MKHRKYIHPALALVLTAILLLAPGCNRASKPAATTAPPERPEITAAPGKAAAPPVERFTDYALRIKPATGPVITLKEPIAAQLVLDALQSERLEVKEKIGEFRATMDVLGPDGGKQYSFTISSDGRALMRYSDGKIIQMPEYVYYLIEETLWTYGGTLVETPLKWTPANGTTAQLELALPRLIKTAMLPAFGYAEAYFCSYKIYDTNTATRDKAKVYMLVTCAGYSARGKAFSPVFLYTTPATLIFTKSGADTWKLTALKQPPKTVEGGDLYTDIRTIFPYECMEAVMADMKESVGAAEQTKDIVQQAIEYLNTVGLSGLTVES